MPELDGLSQRCFRGLFLEAFNNSSGRAFANRFSGAVCDRRGLEHPALMFWTIQEVATRAVLAPHALLSLGASVRERCVLLEGKQVDVCSRRKQAGLLPGTWLTAGSLPETITTNWGHWSRVAFPWCQTGACPALLVPQTCPSLGAVHPGKGLLPR